MPLTLFAAFAATAFVVMLPLCLPMPKRAAGKD